MPVPIARLRELIDLAGSAGVEGVDIVEGGVRIPDHTERWRASTYRVNPDGRAPPEASEADPSIFASPMFGVMHLTPAPDAEPFVRQGSMVVAGQQLCLIEAMKMFHPVHADRTGRIDAIFAEPGAEVVSGQPLFRIVEA